MMIVPGMVWTIVRQMDWGSRLAVGGRVPARGAGAAVIVAVHFDVSGVICVLGGCASGFGEEVCCFG